MKSSIIVIIMLIFSPFIIGWGFPYPINKDNILAGQTIEYKTNFSKEVNLKKTKEEFKNDIIKAINIYLIDDAAISYSNTDIEKYIIDNKLVFPYQTNVQEYISHNVDIKKITYTAIANTINRNIDEIAHHDFNMALNKIFGFIDKAQLSKKDPSFAKETADSKIVPVILTNLIEQPPTNNDKSEYILTADINSYVRYTPGGKTRYYERHFSLANLFFTYDISRVEPQSYSVAIKDIHYNIFSSILGGLTDEPSTEFIIDINNRLKNNNKLPPNLKSESPLSKAMIIDDDALIKCLKSSNLFNSSIDNMVLAELEKNYTKDIDNVVVNMKKVLSKRFVKETESTKVEKVFSVDITTAKSRIQRKNDFFEFNEKQGTYSQHIKYEVKVLNNSKESNLTAKHKYTASLFPDGNSTIVVITSNCEFIQDTLTGKKYYETEITSNLNSFIDKVGNYLK